MPGRVSGVRWYPVKSMQGEDLTGSLFTEQGIPGDRHWGVADTATGVVVSAKRQPRLLEALVKVADGEVVITLPEGSLTGSADPNVDAHHPQGQFDVARFRPNLIIEVDGEGFVEERWVGATIAIGTARLEVVKPTSRCVMTTRAQVGMPRDLDILKTINRVNDGNLGVLANVVGEGTVSVGDAIELA